MQGSNVLFWFYTKMVTCSLVIGESTLDNHDTRKHSVQHVLTCLYNISDFYKKCFYAFLSLCKWSEFRTRCTHSEKIKAFNCSYPKQLIFCDFTYCSRSITAGPRGPVWPDSSNVLRVGWPPRLCWDSVEGRSLNQQDRPQSAQRSAPRCTEGSDTFTAHVIYLYGLKLMCLNC